MHPDTTDMKYINIVLTFFLLNGLSKVYSQEQFFCSSSKIKSASLTRKAGMDKVQDMTAYDVNYHRFDIEVNNISTYVKGSVRTIATVVVPSLSDFTFELHPSLTIDSVIWQNSSLAVQSSGTTHTVTFPNVISQNQLIDLSIFYHGLPSSTGAAAIGNGISSASSPSWGNFITWTLSQPYSAYEWWPCKQDLNDKIDSTDMYVTTNDSLKVGSNGILVESLTLPGSMVRYHWKSRYPIDYYLISLAVGKYVEYNSYAHPVGTDSVFIQNYIYDNPATLTFYKDSLDQTPGFLEHFSEIFGTYPFLNEKYGHSMAPFNGGMEHQTMTTQGVFNFEITAHELAHMWFGDQVTCATWKDLWLNEGFATYSPYLSYEHFRPGQERFYMNGLHNVVLQQPGGSVYVSDTSDVGRLFSWRLTYCKGAAILHSLRFVLQNDDLYYQALQTYQNVYKYSTASASQFKDVVENISGLNLNQFFQQWYYGEGYPIFQAEWNQIGSTVYLKIKQTASAAAVTPLFITPLEVKVQSTAGDTTVRISLNQTTEIVQFMWNKPANGIALDPNQWILNRDSTINQNPLLGIEFTEQTPWSISPNPFTDEFSLLSPFPFDLIEVMDMQGRLVYRSSSESVKTIVKTSNWLSGTYLLRIHSNGTVVTRRIIRK